MWLNIGHEIADVDKMFARPGQTSSNSNLYSGYKLKVNSY